MSFDYELKSNETAILSNAIEDVYDLIGMRCQERHATEEETSMALYSLQDYLSGVSIDGKNLLLPNGVRIG